MTSNPAHLKSKLIVLATTSIFILASNAIAVMLFGALGKTPANSGWNYTLALYIFLAAIPTTYYLSTFDNLKSKTLSLIATILCGALLGFYYGGVAANENPQLAIFSAVCLSILSAIGLRQEKSIISVFTAPISVICAYSFAFFTGTQALALFSVSFIKLGVAYFILCILYMSIVIKILSLEISKNQKN